MRRLSLRPATALKVAAAVLAVGSVVTGCASDPAPAATTGSAAEATAGSSQTPADGMTDPADTAGSGKVTGDNLLDWSDYAAVGLKGLRTRYAAKPAQGALSRCENADMRDVPGRTSLWQSTAEPSDGGQLKAAQQIASFEDAAGADRAIQVFQQWTGGCADPATAHEETDVTGGAKAQTWRYDRSDGTSELVVVVRLPQRVSYGVVSGPTDLVGKLDAKAIAGLTAERLG